AYALFLGLILGIIFIIFRFQLNRKLAVAEAHRLRELDQVKTRLYTNITHEFRTPLTIISGMAEQVRDRPKKRLNEGLDMIKRNSDKLLNLVNQMLDLRKMESGSMSVHWQQGDIIVFLKYIIDSFQSYAASKNIRLHYVSDLESFVMDYDADKTLKIVSNLLSNAIKFTKEDGDIYISVERQIRNVTTSENIQQTIQGDFLEIDVKDTGIGIAESQLQHIFDRFYQADDEPVRQAEGTGIGLALTRELVKLLKGEITVQSRLGKGTTFRVFLPVSHQASPPESPSSLKGHISGFITEPVGQKKSEITAPDPNDEIPLVLIVEDNNDVAHYLKTCLEKDYRLEVATNGREGIDMALEIIPDIIISDVMMPEVDGYTLCQTLKEEERSNHIPIILLTAKADQISKVEGLQRGADAYLSKPFNQEELKVRLQQLIELRRRLQVKYHSGTFAVEAASQQEDEFVLKVRSIIMDHLDDDAFSISQLSRKLHINRVHLHRKIKALTGKTVAHFNRHIRLQEAQHLLMETDLNISEIAYAVGFKDPAYFTRVFVETFGMSPTAMRNQRH
ncbi:MAG: response regulator, partial [Saprospiraceae bacterium]|nr:response regulator [Saprospiraceae bacterium]